MHILTDTINYFNAMDGQFDLGHVTLTILIVQSAFLLLSAIILLAGHRIIRPTISIILFLSAFIFIIPFYGITISMIITGVIDFFGFLILVLSVRRDIIDYRVGIAEQKMKTKRQKKFKEMDSGRSFESYYLGKQ